MDKRIEEKLNREFIEFKEEMMQKSKEEIFENSYKTAAYEEFFFLFDQYVEQYSHKYKSLFDEVMETEEVIGLVYLEVLNSDHTFPQEEHLYSFIDKYTLSSDL